MKLTNIRLINWHIFSDHTIHIDGNVVITGENGHGKSTVIDALFFILSGGEDNYFNNAANAKSSRTLETYIRGKLGIDGNKYLRNANDITAHIVLEFQDPVAGTYKLLGCVLSLNGSRANKRFYIVNDMKLDQIPYVDKETKEVLDFDGLRAICRDKIEGYKVNAGAKSIRNKIGELMQLNDVERYYSLLKKGVAFSPLDENTTRFVNNFLLKEDPLDISNLRGQINGYRNLQNELNKQKAKLTTLESFVLDGEKYLKNAKYIKYLSAVKHKKDVDRNENLINKKEIDLNKLKQQISQNKALINNSQKQLDEFNNTIFALENSDSYQAINANKTNLNNARNDLALLKQKEDQYLVLINNENNIADELGLDYDFNNLVNEHQIDKLNASLRQFVKEVAELKKSHLENKVKCDLKLAELNEVINKDNQAIETLLKGLNNYDEPIKLLMNLLQDKLQSKYNKVIKVSPLCECFEIIDKRWSNAIEGYMGNQKFDLIVDEKYFNDALNIYHDDGKDISMVGIIDTTKKDDIKVLDNSLFSKIKVDNPLAMTKLKQLLGGVVCVDDVNELNAYNAAITDDCMLYKNYVVKRISKARYAPHFIGADSFRQRIDILNNDLTYQNAKKEELRQEIEQSSHFIEVLEQSRFKENDMIDNVWFEIDKVNAHILELETIIKDLESNDDFIGMKEQLDLLRIKRFDAKKENECATKLNDELQNKLGGINDEIKTYNELLAQAKQAYDYVCRVNQFANEYYDYEASILANAKLDPNKMIQNYSIENNMMLKKINRGINEYYSNFEINLGNSIDDLPNYISAYNKLKKYNVVHYEQKAKEAYQNAKKSFNENFVTSLRGKINNAKANINAINDVLRKHPFSNDEEIYRFTFDASKDKNMANYYRVITSNTMMGEQLDLLVETMPEKDQQIIKDLFEKVACDTNDSSAMETLEELLDYRRYMSFDIEISNKYNQKYHFSEIAKEKSGGETQTPFYVVIAACFEELFKKGAYNSSCIIVYDEAFNNMDETRITTLLDYYHSLKHIQFMIVVPTNRAAYLTPSMDLTIGLVKQNNYVNLHYIGKKHE